MDVRKQIEWTALSSIVKIEVPHLRVSKALFLTNLMWKRQILHHAINISTLTHHVRLTMCDCVYRSTLLVALFFKTMALTLVMRASGSDWLQNSCYDSGPITTDGLDMWPRIWLTSNITSGHPNINFDSPCVIACIVRHFLLRYASRLWPWP